MTPEPAPILSFMELLKNVIGFSHDKYTIMITIHKAIPIVIIMIIAFCYVIKRWRKKEI